MYGLVGVTPYQTERSETMTDSNLMARADELKSLENFKKEIEAEIDAIKDELKKEMESRDKDELFTGNYHITYKVVESHRFDSKALKKDNEELFNKYNKTTSYKRFSIN